MRPRPKYQVFVSSTFEDLRAEREAVTWSILKLFLIPAGMEAFPAASDRGWDTIRRVIDDSDYYVLIVAGRYGSIDAETGISWTHREYRYALERGIPVLAFVRDASFITQDKVERERRLVRRHADFLAEIRSSHLHRTWKPESDLCQVVSESLTQRIRQDEYEGTQRPGWFRGDVLPGLDSLNEFARLSSENARLRRDVEALAGRGTVTLELAKAGGDPLNATYVEERPLYVYKEQALASFLRKVMASEDELREYLDCINRTVWVELGVKNSGQEVGREISVDFEVDALDDVYTYAIPQPILHPEQRETEEPKSITDPSQHRYIDIVRGSGENAVFMRQRIRSVTPGNVEPLTRFGLLLPVDGTESLRCTVRYKIFHSHGPGQSGEFSLAIKHGPSEEIEPGEAF